MRLKVFWEANNLGEKNEKNLSEIGERISVKVCFIFLYDRFKLGVLNLSIILLVKLPRLASFFFQ